jgi:hypothetical protein
MARAMSKKAARARRKRHSQYAYPGQEACRRGFKVGDKVSIRGGWFSGKPWKKPTRGVIKAWSGCGVAEVEPIGRSFERGERYDISLSDLKRRR